MSFTLTAPQLGITGYSKLTKDQLITKLTAGTKVAPEADSGRHGAVAPPIDEFRDSATVTVSAVSALTKPMVKTIDVGSDGSEQAACPKTPPTRVSSNRSSTHSNGSPAKARDRSMQSFTKCGLLTSPIPLRPSHVQSAADRALPSTGDRRGKSSEIRPRINAGVAESHAKLGTTASRPVSMRVSRFKPLARVTPSQEQRVSPLEIDQITQLVQLQDDSTRRNRTDYIKGHFLEAMMRNLHAHKRRPVFKAPFPGQFCSSTQSSAIYDLAFQGVAPSLYEATDPAAFCVALRFNIFRLHSSLQLGTAEASSGDGALFWGIGNDISKWPAVIKAERVSPEVWMLTLMSNTAADSHTPASASNCSPRAAKRSRISIDETSDTNTLRYLVLEAIGEPIGSSKLDQRLDQGEPGGRQITTQIHDCYLRADWRTLLEHQNQTAKGDICRLIRTKETHDYPAGVSKAWMARISTQSGIHADPLIAIAKRCALSSCVLNRQVTTSPNLAMLTALSTTGTKLSATLMDLEWTGHTIKPYLNCDRTSTKLEFYLPESHRIDSVHIPGAPWHPQLVMVHRTSGYTDIALHETGQVVGDESSGVAPLWQGILGCDEKGNKLDSSDGFWVDWEARIG